MSFGSDWLDIDEEGRTLTAVAKRLKRSGPKSIRSDNVLLEAHRGTIRVALEGTWVGTMKSADGNEYLPVLQAVGVPVQTSGIVLVDATDHPGVHLKLFAPEAQWLVPANTPEARVPCWFALDRAGGVTLASTKSAHALIGEASHGLAESCSVWILANRQADGSISFFLNGSPLPTMPSSRAGRLSTAWDKYASGHSQLQLEAMHYPVKAGPQVNVRYALGR